MIVTFRQVTSAVRVLAPARSFAASCAKFKDERHDAPHLQIQEPTIPSYVERQSEDTHVKRARLLYQSRKRGMLENGLLLSTFAGKYLNYFDDKQLQLYDHLINLPSNDWDIFYWATGVKPVPPEFDNEVMTLLKKHIQNDDRQSRITQPDL